MVAAFEAATISAATTTTFAVSGVSVHAETPLYTVQLNLKRRGLNAGSVRVSLVAKGALRKRLGARVMRSVEDVRGQLF
jgi:hypothetical protein